MLRATRAAVPELAVPLPLAKEDRALMADVPFTIPGDLADIAAVTLVLGVRDNDVKNFAAVALDQLASLNADPNGQKQHCLRRAEQDEPTGSQAAVDDCRAYIRETLLSALEGLGSDGLPDGDQREPLQVTLSIRGEVTVSVPMFYLRAGRAIHAIEDSFTHTFRNAADRHKITVVLNWIEYADDTLIESRDGPAHMKELDRCDDPDERRAERHRLAVEAGTAALSVLLDRTTDRAAKSSGVDAVLDKYLSFDTEAHCTSDNHWCNAPELAYANTGCGCAAAGREPWTRSPWLAFAALGGLVLLFRVRRRVRITSTQKIRRAGRRRHAAALASTLGSAVALCPHEAQADSPLSGMENSAPVRALKGKSNAGAPSTEDPVGAFFGRADFGASYDNPALTGGLGLRYQISRPLMFGFDAELNPWIATSPTRVRAGAFNAYVSIIRRFQLKTESLNIRSQAGIGLSVLLIDLVGAPAGSSGPFFGLSFLGVEWKVARGFYLTIDPTYLALPVPHLTGAPFGYPQYRFLVGVEFGG